MKRRDFLKLSSGFAAVAISHPTLLAQEADPDREAEILKRTAERIEMHRKGPAQIQLRTAEGKPVRGAQVSLRQTRHAFQFGCNAFMVNRCGEADLEEAYRRQFANLFNFATLGFYWANFEATQGRPNYEYIDKVLEWTAAAGIRCKGHPLVWDHPAGSPRWLPEEGAKISELSLARVREIVTRYRGRIDVWDVVNEATHLPNKVNRTRMAGWAESLGPVPYVARHLKAARSASTSAALIVNDYRLDDPYYRILEKTLADDARAFDIVGIQSHMHDRPWKHTRVWDTCEKYAQLRLPLHFTETTIVSGPRKGPGENWGETTSELEAKQAMATEQLYRVLFSHPAVEALTWWDFSDRGAWQRAAAGFIRKDMTPKPVYETLLRMIKRNWWTDGRGVSSDEGQVGFRAFYGKHQLTVQLANGRRHEQELVLERGKPSSFSVII